MFIYKDLDKKVFDDNKMFEELLIITGYITPSYVERIYESFSGCINIYLGMGDSKYKSNVYNSLKTILRSLGSDRINVYYTNEDIHAKIYIWKSPETNKILIGSANFSDSMKIAYKEVLGSYDIDEDLKTYCDYIISNSVNINDVPIAKIKKTNAKESKYKHTKPILVGENGALLSFLSSKKGTKNILGVAAKMNHVHAASGLNWGFSNGASSLNDGCIPIPVSLIKNDLSMLRIPKSSNRIFKGIWDDGVEMQIQFEGNNVVNGEKFPKQIASFPDKDIMGKYLRQRIGDKIGRSLLIPDDREADDFLSKKKIRQMNAKDKKDVKKKYLITLEDLTKYGRYDVEITDMGDGTYYFDFSTND